MDGTSKQISSDLKKKVDTFSNLGNRALLQVSEMCKNTQKTDSLGVNSIHD